VAAQATTALQFAHAAGCQVFVTSGSGEKNCTRQTLGAAAGVITKHRIWAEQLQQLSGGFDVIIDSALAMLCKLPDFVNQAVA